MLNVVNVPPASLADDLFWSGVLHSERTRGTSCCVSQLFDIPIMSVHVCRTPNAPYVPGYIEKTVNHQRISVSSSPSDRPRTLCTTPTE